MTQNEITFALQEFGGIVQSVIPEFHTTVHLLKMSPIDR